MVWASSVPAAIAALHALAAGAVEQAAAGDALFGVTVSDGPILSAGDHLAGALTIGYPGGDEDTAAESTADPDGWVSAPDRESFTISCAASVLDGDNDMAAARTTAYAIVGAYGGLLAADHTLGGVVLRASITTSTLHQTQMNQGAIATVSFAVACEAFTQL